jgi:hypothetical protein
MHWPAVEEMNDNEKMERNGRREEISSSLLFDCRTDVLPEIFILD